VSALVAYVAFFMVWKLLPPGRTTAPSQGRFDYLGAVLFVPGIVAILLSISHWRQWQGGVLPPWLILACGLAIVAAWLWHELRVRQPLVNVHLLANRQVVFTILCLAFMCAGPMSYGMIIPMLLTQPAWNIPGAGLTAMQASYVISIPVLLGLIGALACAPLVRTVGARATMIMAAGLMSASWIALTTAHDTPWQIGLLLTPMCIGSAITLAVIPVLYNEVVPLDHTSETNRHGGAVPADCRIHRAHGYRPHSQGADGRRPCGRRLRARTGQFYPSHRAGGRAEPGHAGLRAGAAQAGCRA
jgi:hypothetical protein